MGYLQQTAVECAMLIVEDEEVARETLKTALARKYPGLLLHVASSGREGLRLFHEVQPEIVLTDLQMPGMSGIEMAQQFRNLAPRTQIIVVTAHSDPHLLLDCINLDVSRYLLKPIGSESLFGAIDDCLERLSLEAKLKAQHEELVESGEQLRLALESAALGTWDYQLDTGDIVWDERCRCMFGVEVSSRVDYRTALGRVHPEDRAGVDRAVAEAVAGAGDGVYHQEFRVVWPDGSLHWLASHGKVYFDGEGVSRFIGAVMDITARVRATEELQESEARYRGLFSSLQEGFSLHEAVLGADGVDYRFLEVNPAFERLAGLGRSFLIGRTLSQVFPELEERWLSCLATVATTGEPATLEHHAALSDRYYEAQVYSPTTGQVAVLYSDVSERRKLQMEREKNERLESLGVLAGGIAHDFNNILMAIAGNISLARLQLEHNEAVDARLEDSEKAVAKAAALTRQLLTFARGGEPVKKSLATAPLICEAASLFLSGGNCKAELLLPEDLWCLYGDPGQMHQALNNLILNAVQSMPGGGMLSISASNRVVETVDGSGVTPGRYLRIVIADQGGGIAAEHLPRIFDPYFTTKATGSGLGLASVFSIVKRHGGAISVSSPPDAGASFELLLPASERASEDTGCEAPAPVPRTSQGCGRKILVMDDEEMIRNLAGLMLAKLGYRPTVCSDGAEAVALYRDSFGRGEGYAAVILDMTVPGGMGGKEAAQRIRAVDGEAVLVISSGYSSDPFLDERQETQVNGTVAKPYNLKQLSEELTRVIGPD
jgi:two-component system, cell cycle sensor histidine kinase and response regulator CckA